MVDSSPGGDDVNSRDGGRSGKTRMLRTADAAALLLTSAVLWSALPASHAVGAAEVRSPVLFETSDRCVACHNGVTTASGADISIGYDWRASMMANSARDPYWHAAVRREIMDFPAQSAAIQDECSKCHMPMARTAAVDEGRVGSVFDHLPIGAADDTESLLAADGVSCSMCHQIGPEALGTRESETGGYRIAPSSKPGDRPIYGPFVPDSGRTRVMHSASGFVPTEGKHIQESAFCATCHTLRTHSLGPGAGATLPEQTPYQEWQASSFAQTKSCQSCHMPEVEGDAPVSAVLGQPRSNVSRHVFLGGNFFMLRMLSRHRNELGVIALPQELDAAVARTIDHLQASTARVALASATIQNGRLVSDVSITNLAGHKFPTAYPSRRAWLHMVVRDGSGAVIFESGAFASDGSITGNDSDRDAALFEPHYQTIDRADQVQVYESVMADPQGRPTTGLLTAVRFVKDNRILPDGFNRAAAAAEIAVQGDAAQDPDFGSGADLVRYSVDLTGRSGPYSVAVELWFQPIAFRWAKNLASYDAPEPRRFGAWYNEMASSSAIVVARAELSGVR